MRKATVAREFRASTTADCRTGRTMPGNKRVLLHHARLSPLSLNADTGQPDPALRHCRRVDLWDGLNYKVELNQIGASSPPMIVGDVAVIGNAMQGGASPRTTDNVPGHIRGYDVRTGKMLWIFHTIPKAGELGIETWENNSWKNNGNTGVWAPMSADPELGYVYLPVETPTSDYYGGHRHGDNFSETALSVSTRKPANASGTTS